MGVWGGGVYGVAVKYVSTYQLSQDLTLKNQGWGAEKPE
jgi:hypothetical protein